MMRGYAQVNAARPAARGSPYRLIREFGRSCNDHRVVKNRLPAREGVGFEPSGRKLQILLEIESNMIFAKPSGRLDRIDVTLRYRHIICVNVHGRSGPSSRPV